MRRLAVMSPCSIRLESSTSSAAAEQVPADLLQEELEGVGRGLEHLGVPGRRRRLLGRLLLRLDHLDVALLESGR